jgi:hypothetical protein
VRGWGSAQQQTSGLLVLRHHSQTLTGLYNAHCWLLCEQVASASVHTLNADAAAALEWTLLVDLSCRNLHEANQPTLMHPLITAFQWLLLNTLIGRWIVQVGARRVC